MATGKLLNEIIFVAAFALPGGALVVLAFMTAFVVVGRALLMIRHSRALRLAAVPGHPRGRGAVTPGAAVVSD
ncbi:MAG TPA: hypothetical protein VNM47_09005 [Terriglobia bacterium]|nr:hypothetical protein [Terriglobia bacterium]